MKQQKLVYVSTGICDAYVEPEELPLQKYLNDGWRIVSYQPVGNGNGDINVVVLLEKGN